jgi:hypothetical protein
MIFESDGPDGRRVSVSRRLMVEGGDVRRKATGVP